MCPQPSMCVRRRRAHMSIGGHDAMYQRLIERTSTAWSTPLLDHLSDDDRQRFQLFGQGPVAAVPDTHIHHAFERHATIRPDATAAEHHGETITYGELDRQANRLAALL